MQNYEWKMSINFYVYAKEDFQKIIIGTRLDK